jgi:pimeloyl-ACP methyl ester carboxylesterase
MRVPRWARRTPAVSRRRLRKGGRRPGDAPRVLPKRLPQPDSGLGPSCARGSVLSISTIEQQWYRYDIAERPLRAVAVPGCTPQVSARVSAVRPSRPELPPAVFAHGPGGSAQNWAELMAELSDDVRGEAVDLVGFGHSPPPDDGDLSISGYVRACAGSRRLPGGRRLGPGAPRGRLIGCAGALGPRNRRGVHRAGRPVSVAAGAAGARTRSTGVRPGTSWSRTAVRAGPFRRSATHACWSRRTPDMWRLTEHPVRVARAFRELRARTGGAADAPVAQPYI